MPIGAVRESTRAMGIDWVAWSCRSVHGALLGGDGCDHAAVDLTELALGAGLEGGGGDPIDVAELAVGGFVEQGDGVGGEYLTGGTGAAEAMLEVLGGVRGAALGQLGTGVDAGPEGAVLAELQSGAGVRETDEDDGQEGAGVPLVVGQDVQVLEDI